MVVVSHGTVEDGMGRPPIGEAAMTDAQRQRRRREQLGWDPERLPWNPRIETTTRATSELLWHLRMWMAHQGTDLEIATWLADMTSRNVDGWMKLSDLVRARIEADEVELVKWEAEQAKAKE
jgi:hypothetical protein